MYAHRYKLAPFFHDMDLLHKRDQWWFAPLIWAGAYAAELMISDPGEGANLGCRRGLNQ